MFKGAVRLLHFEPRDGMAVLALGSISVYERSGEYQLYVELLEPDGVGGFYLAFQQLKDKLAGKVCLMKQPKAFTFICADCWCDYITHRCRNQRYNQCCAARFPGIKILLAPALVQGDEASKSIIKSLKILNDNKLVDVIIIARRRLHRRALVF